MHALQSLASWPCCEILVVVLVGLFPAVVVVVVLLRNARGVACWAFPAVVVVRSVLVAQLS